MVNGQSTTLEREAGDRDAGAEVRTVPVDIPEDRGHDAQLARLDLSGSLARQSKPITHFDPVINRLANSIIAQPKPPDQLISVATASEIAQSFQNIKEYFDISLESDIVYICTQLVVYYANNSTSPQNPHRFDLHWNDVQYPHAEIDKQFVPTPRLFFRGMAKVVSEYIRQRNDWMPYWGQMHGFPWKYRYYAFDCADALPDIPPEARRAILAAKDVALSRTQYNLMLADLKAAGNGAGTVIEQVAGQHFSKTAADRSMRAT